MTDEQRTTPTPEKLPYTPPEVTKRGTVAELTWSDRAETLRN